MELTRSDCFPLFLLSSQCVTPKAVPVAYVQRSRIRLATTPSQQATAIDTPLDPTTAVSSVQNHLSALSALNVGLHATLLLSPRTVLLLLGDPAIRTACQRTPVGAQ